MNNTDTETLEDELTYLLALTDEDDFIEKESTIKEYLIEIANACNIDYLEWRYKNLLINI